MLEESSQRDFMYIAKSNELGFSAVTAGINLHYQNSVTLMAFYKQGVKHVCTYVYTIAESGQISTHFSCILGYISNIRAVLLLTLVIVIQVTLFTTSPLIFTTML